MSEYITKAVVLGSRDSKEHDRIFDLYTEELGKIRVRAPGSRKMLSKLSPHLDFVSLVTVKVVEKNNLTLVDAFREDSIRGYRADGKDFAGVAKLLGVVRALSPEVAPDPNLWDFIVNSLHGGSADFRRLLSLLGYDPQNARCEECGRADVVSFDVESQSFFCGRCGLRINEDNLIELPHQENAPH